LEEVEKTEPEEIEEIPEELIEKKVMGEKIEEVKTEVKPEVKTEEKKVEGSLQKRMLLLEKRFVDLELSFEELKEKIKGADSNVLADIEQRLGDLEDMGLVDALGVSELNNLLGNIEKRYEELESRKPVFSMTPEDIGKISASVIPVVETTIMSKVGERLKETPAAHVAPEDLDKALVGVKKDIEDLKNKTKPIEQEVLQKVVSEIADLRTETGKEIREVKDKIEGVATTKSDIDIKFLSSRVNAMKENVDFMVNRKAETDMKIENLKKAILKIAEGAVSTDIIRAIENNEKVLADLTERIGSIENSMKGLEGVGKKMEEVRREPGISFKEPLVAADSQIAELLDKIIFLESRMKAIENSLDKKGKNPIILE
jgi:DNA-binding HxlR family transcriptional regulator